MPYSGHASLNNAASQKFPLSEGHQEEQERDAATRPTELTRMQTAAREAEEEELKKTGRNEVQQGGTASQVKAGAEYLEKEVSFS